MGALLLSLLLALPAGAQLVKSIEPAGRSYAVNGVPAVLLGFGTYKDVLIHPLNPDLVVKVFRNNLAPGLEEKRAEQAALKQLVPIGAAPKLVDQGAVLLHGKPTGFLVQERVRGLSLANPTPLKLAQTRQLFEKLRKAGLRMVDVESLLKLRENLMVGETASGGFQAWLVDPDVEKSGLSARQLAAFYDGLQGRLSSR